MKLITTKDKTSKTLLVFIQDSSSTNAGVNTSGDPATELNWSLE